MKETGVGPNSRLSICILRPGARHHVFLGAEAIKGHCRGSCHAGWNGARRTSLLRRVAIRGCDVVVATVLARGLDVADAVRRGSGKPSWRRRVRSARPPSVQGQPASAISCAVRRRARTPNARLEDVSRTWMMSVGHKRPTSLARPSGPSVVAMVIKGTNGEAPPGQLVGSRWLAGPRHAANAQRASTGWRRLRTTA